MNNTLRKFGYPDTCLAETANWCVLLRPVQVTLGSLVIAYKDANVLSLSDVSLESLSDFLLICSHVEKTLTREFNADKFNYLALMMVDPQVHFHVLPRYAEPAEFERVLFPDDKWPGPPDVMIDGGMSSDTFEQLKTFLKSRLSLSDTL